MKYLLIGVDDATDLESFDKTLHGLTEVRTVEAIETTESKKPIYDPTGVLERNLAIPGPPLTDAEMEVLVEDMEAETEFVPAEEVWEKMESLYKSKDS